MIVVELPIKTTSELNRASHEHWRKRHERMKEQRVYTRLLVAARWRSIRPRIELPVIVTLTRIAPRELDAHDNLPGSMKAIVDGVADALGVKDKDKRVRWAYDQKKGPPKTYGVVIMIEPRQLELVT